MGRRHAAAGRCHPIMANLMLDRSTEAVPLARVHLTDLSIVIVTWNSGRWIERCLRSIPAACEGLQYEIVLHDNASSDATLQLVDAAAPAGALRVIRSAENAGFARATNRGFAESSGRYVFLLNPDCELEPGTLTLLVEFLDSHPEAAAAAPLLADESGSSQRDFQLRRFPTLGILVSELLLFHKIRPENRAGVRYRYRDLDLTVPQRVEQPAAAALLLRREAFERVGPFDEQFSPAWFEDVDYCQRLAHAHLEVWAVPAAKGRHYGGASLEHMDFARFAEVWYRNMWRYARKWMGPVRAEVLRWAIVAGMLLRCGVALFGFAPRLVGRAAATKAYARVLRRALARWEER